MRKLLIIIVIIIISGGILTIAATNGMDEIRKYKIPEINMDSIDDGEYQGESTIGRWALAVRVTVENHKIKDIIITDKKESNITDDLKAEYDLRIRGTEVPVFDTISAASITGKAYLIAVTNALDKVQEHDCGCFK